MEGGIMKKCPYCSTKMEDFATLCPSCKKKVSKKSKNGIAKKPTGCFAKLFLLVIVLIVIYGIFNLFLIEEKYYEKRYPFLICPRDGINIRTGPGINYKKDESGTLFEGEKLYILEEKNGWLRFRVTPADMGWSGWVKSSLIPKQFYTDSKKLNDILYTVWIIKQDLKNGSILKKIYPARKEAYVSLKEWDKLDKIENETGLKGMKRHYAEQLSMYCRVKKNGILNIGDIKKLDARLNKVVIKNHRTGKVLAEYSGSSGFKEHH